MTDERPTQDEVLAKKDNVTKTSRGLQIWDDDIDVEGMQGEHGDASEGTAERSARLGREQKARAARSRDE